MNNRHWLLKANSTIGLILTLGISMNVQAGLFGIGGTSWKEEVLLHDGRKIIVQRTLERGGRHEIGQPSGVMNETLTFTMPDTHQTVIWNDKYSDDILSSNFNLMMLEVFKGSAYLVASPKSCLSYGKWGRPNPPYVVFKHQGQDWLRIPLQELPAEFVIPNLIQSSPGSVAKNTGESIVSAETIKKLRERHGYQPPETKTILRSPIDRQGACPLPTGPDGLPLPSKIINGQ